MLVYAGIAFLVLIAVVLMVAATKPGTFAVERSTVIAAPPEAIEPLISNFHNWASWSPWEHLDPQMAKTFAGETAGVGAVYEWSGNAKAGAGRMEILDATPTSTDIKLDFYKPFPSAMKALFTLTAEPAGTRVQWLMTGPQKFFPSKIMSVFVSMDKMIGGDFERGLTVLKSIAETRLR